MSLRRERWSAALWACHSFRGAHRSALLWAGARMINAPLAALEDDLLSFKGRLLSVGCGFGVVERYLARRNPDLGIVGFELEEDRVQAAAATQATAGPVIVHRADVTELGDVGRFDGALAMDVLHHLEPYAQVALLAALARLVRPGGLVLVKDIAATPRWQHAFNSFHDRLAVGDKTHCRTPADMCEILAGTGMRVEDWCRVGRFSPYPHYVIRARVPEIVV